MTRFQRLVVVLVVLNLATTWWVFNTADQATDARSDYLAYLNVIPMEAVAAAALESPQGIWVNETAKYHASAVRWTGIGYVVSLFLLVGAWIISGRRSNTREP